MITSHLWLSNLDEICDLTTDYPETQATGLVSFCTDKITKLNKVDVWETSAMLPPFALAGLNKIVESGVVTSLAKANLAVFTLGQPRFDARISKLHLQEMHKISEKEVDLNHSGGNVLVQKMPRPLNYMLRDKRTLWFPRWAAGWMSATTRYCQIQMSDVVTCLHGLAQQSNYIKNTESVRKAAKEYVTEFFYQAERFSENQKHELTRMGAKFLW